jgi:hypothetical protein
MYILGRARQIEAEEHMLDKPGMYAANQISLRERQVAPIERATNGWHDAQERAERVVAALDCGEHPAVCLRARLALGIMAAEYVGVENLSAIIDSEPPESPEAESQP